MITRQIELSLDTARRWYEQGGELRELALGAFSKQALIGGRLPKTWDEFCEENDIRKDECFIGEFGTFLPMCFSRKRHANQDKNKLPSQEAGIQHLAYIQLHQLRDCYRKGWLPNLEDEADEKYGIERLYNRATGRFELRVVWYDHVSTFLLFPSYKMANEFLTNFRELIEQAGDLI